jgi:hypothetical protein
MEEIHRLLAQVALVLALLSAGWAAVLMARATTGGRLFLVNLGWTAVTIAAGGIVGAFLVVTGPGPSDGLHLLYGALALVALPGAALAASGRPARQRAIVLLVGSIVVVIIVVRLFQTG